MSNVAIFVILNDMIWQYATKSTNSIAKVVYSINKL